MRIVTRYSPWGQATQPRSINLMTWTILDLGTRGLKIALTTNFELGPQFAGIWLPPIKSLKVQILHDSNKFMFCFCFEIMMLLEFECDFGITDCCFS